MLLKRIGLIMHRTSPFREEALDFASKMRSYLQNQITRAIRARIWWAMNETSRGIIQLCVKQNVRFVSPMLLRALTKALKALSMLLNPIRRFEEEGKDLAWRMSEVAASWGHSTALGWRRDKGYMRYLGMLIIEHRNYGLH